MLISSTAKPSGPEESVKSIPEYRLGASTLACDRSRGAAPRRVALSWHITSKGDHVPLAVSRRTNALGTPTWRRRKERRLLETSRIRRRSAIGSGRERARARRGRHEVEPTRRPPTAAGNCGINPRREEEKKESEAYPSPRRRASVTRDVSAVYGARDSASRPAADGRRESRGRRRFSTYLYLRRPRPGKSDVRRTGTNSHARTRNETSVGNHVAMANRGCVASTVIVRCRHLAAPSARRRAIGGARPIAGRRCFTRETLRRGATPCRSAAFEIRRRYRQNANRSDNPGLLVRDRVS